MGMVNEIKIKISILLDEAKAKLNELKNGLGNLGNQSNAGNIKTELDGVGKSATGLKNTLDRVGGDIKGTIAGMFAVGALIAFTNKLVETVRIVQDLRLRLSGLTKGNDDFAASEAYLTDLAHKHHKSVQDLTASYSSLLVLEQANVITRQQSIQLLEGLSNVGSKLGASSTQIGQAVYGLSQALSQGTVQATEFNQIIEPLPGLGNEIAKAFGVESVGALRKQIGEGKIASEMLGVKMVQALKAYEGAAERSGGTISASYSDVANAYTEMAKELEKPVAGLAIGVTDVGKSAYGWLKDNGNAVVNVLTGIAVVMLGKGVAAMAAYTRSGIESIQVEQAHTAAIIENEQRTVTARETKVLAAQTKLQERTATAELAQAELLLAEATLQQARANELASGSAAMLVDAQIAQTAAVAKLTAATRSQAAADSFLIGQNAKLAESQLALTAATNASGVAVTRMMAAFKAASAFVGGAFGVAVIGLWGLYEVLNRVTDAEEKAEKKAQALTDSLVLMNKEVSKLTAETVDIDFSKTLKSLDEVNAKIKTLEEFDWSKIGGTGTVGKFLVNPIGTLAGVGQNLGDLSAQRENLLQQKAVLEKRQSATTEKKNDLITNFDASTLSAQELNSALADTQAQIKTITDRVTPLQAQVKEGLISSDAVNADLLLLKAYDSKLSAIQGSLNSAAKSGKTDPKIAEANAKAEEKEIASNFKLKEQQAKNAFDVAMAYAEKDAAKKIQLEKDYNQQSLALTLERLNAEIAAKTKTSELSGKKTKAPELQAELADLENQKLAAIDNAKTKGVTLDIDQQKQADNLREKQQAAEHDLALARIDTELLKVQAEQKTELDNLKRDRAQGRNFDGDLKAASQKHGFDYEAVQAQFAQSAAKHGVPEQVLKAQAFQESGFNPRIKSSVGAVGFSQFLEGTARQYGLSDRTDPIASIEAQARMMGEKIRQYGGRLDLALAAYNGGDKGADYLARNPQYLQNPEARIKGDAKHNSLYKVETANYQKTILSSAGLVGDSGVTSAGGQGEKQFFEQSIANTKHYYEAKTTLESNSIDANINAIKAKLVLAEQKYTTEKETATPEELPKIEADYTAQKEKLTQELTQLQADLLAIKKDGDAEMAKEIAKAKQEEIDLEESSALELVKIAETEAQQQLELGQLSNGKFLEKQQDFEDQRYQIALKAAQDRRALLDEGDTAGKAKALGQEKALTNKHAADLKAINHKMALDSQQSFNSIVAPIKSAFTSNIQGILQGTMTLKQGMKNIFQSIMLSYAQTLAGMAIDAAAHWAWELLGFGAKETGKATLKTTSEAAQTAATVGGVAIRQGVETAAHAQSAATAMGTGIALIGNKAAEAAASTYSSVAAIPYVGWLLAPPAAAAAFVAVAGYQSMLTMFSSAGGEWDVPSDRLNLVHKNETILPATIAAPMRDFFTKQGTVSYGLPAIATQPFTNQSATMATVASALVLQQSMMQSQQKQQRQKSNSGTVVLNTKGGNFVHKNDVIALLKKENRNFKMVTA